MSVASVDDPPRNDNREYDYAGIGPQQRAEYPVICDWVETGSRVIDLGCGEGSLLALLARQKGATAFGIERAASGVAQCRQKGLEVVQGAIDEGLPAVSDGQFDYAICNATLQMVLYPEVLLREMARIARRQILSFPNFANIRNRLDLLLAGRMPRPMLFGYSWHDTGHIHQCSVHDVREFVHRLGLKVERERHLGRLAALGLGRLWPNLFSTVTILQTRSERV